MAVIGALNILASVDHRGFDKGSKKVESRADKLAKNIGRLRGVFAGAFAGLGVLELGKKMVMLGSDANEMESKLNAVWLGLADDARKWSDATADAIGRSQWEVRKFHTELGDLFQPMGFAADEALKLSGQVTQLAYDLASFNNIADDEALERLRGTLVGSHENALKFGVVINEASLKTELLAMGAQKVNGEFTTQQKVMARLNLLMKGTTAAHGDAARTADGFAGTMKSLKGQLEEVGTALGQELIVPLKEALNLTKELLNRWEAIKHGPGDVGKPTGATRGEAFLNDGGRQRIAQLPTLEERLPELAKRQEEAFKLREEAKKMLRQTMQEVDDNVNGPFWEYDPVKDFRLNKEEDRLRELVKQLDTEIKSIGSAMKVDMRPDIAENERQQKIKELGIGQIGKAATHMLGEIGKTDAAKTLMDLIPSKDQIKDGLADGIDKAKSMARGARRDLFNLFPTPEEEEEKKEPFKNKRNLFAGALDVRGQEFRSLVLGMRKEEPAKKALDEAKMQTKLQEQMVTSLQKMESNKTTVIENF